MPTRSSTAPHGSAILGHSLGGIARRRRLGKVLQLLVVNRLLDPGSEFRGHRQWHLSTAMDALLGTMLASWVEIDELNGVGKMQGHTIPNPFDAVADPALLECAAIAASVGFSPEAPELRHDFRL